MPRHPPHAGRSTYTTEPDESENCLQYCIVFLRDLFPLEIHTWGCTQITPLTVEHLKLKARALNPLVKPHQTALPFLPSTVGVGLPGPTQTLPTRWRSVPIWAPASEVSGSVCARQASRGARAGGKNLSAADAEGRGGKGGCLAEKITRAHAHRTFWRLFLQEGVMRTLVLRARTWRCYVALSRSLHSL